MNNKRRYNPNIYHRRSIRLKGHDYSQAGLYFITICCLNRACLFGEIVCAKNVPRDKRIPKMILNDAGKIANDCWLNIPNHFPNAVLHQHIIMPNHIHGIIELVGAENFPPNNIYGTDHDNRVGDVNRAGDDNRVGDVNRAGDANRAERSEK